MSKIKFTISLEDGKEIAFPHNADEKPAEFLALPQVVFEQMVYAETPSLCQTHPEDNEEYDFEITYIDEEGLLPGTHEPTEKSGVLHVKERNESTQIKFAPIAEQSGLSALHLRSQNKKISYQLSKDEKTLFATAGRNKEPVFKVTLDDDGAYTFTLKRHIDRPAPTNLIVNGNFARARAGKAKGKGLSGWDTHNDQYFNSLIQHIQTEPTATYQLTLLMLPQIMKTLDAHPIQIYWNNELVHTVETNHLGPQGFTFTLLGNPDDDYSTLKLHSQNSLTDLTQCLDQVIVSSQAQLQLPLDFEFLIKDSAGTLAADHFVINVTTTPPIEINNQMPFDIYYDQAVYQTIIVNDDSPNQNPLTKINLDSLFNNMAIPAENRHVEVVQREENGMATNVYEIKISDNAQDYAPITVADVQLSFPGGDGGLSVFQRNISIDDGGGSAPTALDPII